MDNIHVGDIGTVFKIKITDDAGLALNISAATTLKIIFLKPNKERLEKTATFSTDGTDGYIQYSTIAGDLDRPGAWKIQGYVVEASYTNSSQVDTFHVKPNN